MQTSEDLYWGGELQYSGVVSPMHNFEASESKRALSNGFVESARNSYNPGGEIVEPPSQFNQGNGHFNMHEMLWAEDEIEPGESRRGPAKVSVNSSFSYREMLDPSFAEINQGDGLSYMHVDGGFHNASSYSYKDSKRAPFETSNHGEQFDFNSADLVIHNQQPSDGKGTNLAPFETPNYIETSSFNGFHNVIHKQNSSDFRHLKRERELFGMEYSFMPARGNESEKPSSTFRNEYHSLQSHVKVEDNIVLTPSTDLVSRASEVVDSAINGCPSQRPTTEGIEWSRSKCLPSISCKNYGIHSKFETEEELFQSRRALPSRGMPGDTSVKSSAVVAQVQESDLQVSEHPGVMPPSSISTGSNNILKKENEAPKFYDSHISKSSKTSEQSNGDDDSDLCILEDMSAPARSNHVAMSDRFVGAKQVLTSREPGIQTVTHSRRKPNDERVIFRVALQVNSLASLCCL